VCVCAHGSVYVRVCACVCVRACVCVSMSVPAQVLHALSIWLRLAHAQVQTGAASQLH